MKNQDYWTFPTLMSSKFSADSPDTIENKAELFPVLTRSNIYVWNRINYI